RRRLQARHECHRRLQRGDRPDGALPLPVWHRAGEGVRGHADHGHRCLDDHGRVRDPHLLSHLAGSPASHVHAEHLTMTRFFANANYDFIGVRKYAYALTAAIIVPGLLFLLVKGLNYSIEFTGGTLLQITAKQAVD